MSILAAAICEKNGDLLLSRQFSTAGVAQLRQMEEAYPTLLNQGTRNSALEQDGLRYIFEPLDELFVTLVSDVETSNILQDLKTLRLLTQLVKTVVAPGSGTVSTKDIAESYPNITDAFDEVVSMGYPENLTVAQVQTFLQMESHEEKIQQIIERNKQLEAAEERKKRAKEFDLQRQAEKMNARFAASSASSSYYGANGSDSGTGSRAPGLGASGFGSSSGLGPSSSLGSGSGSGSGSGFPGSGFSGSSDLYESSSQVQPTPSLLKGKGLKLGKKSVPITGGAGMALLADPEPLPSKFTNPALSGTAVAPASASSRQASAVPSSTTTDISIVEQLTVELTREGEVKTSRVSGTLNLFAGDREHTKLQIRTKTDGGASDYKPHPKMDRAKFASNRVLTLKNASEDLPASQVLLAKWTVDNGVVVPLTISCWVSKAADAGFLNVTLEYEVSSDFTGTLENIVVSAPLPTSNAHPVDPTSNYEQFDDRIVWIVPTASSTIEPSGSFEFTAEADGEDDFYPIEVTFTTAEQSGPGELTTFGKIDVDDVVDLDSNDSVQFNKTASAKTASFVIR